MSDQHRKEYLRRIHHAQDFIEQHIAEALDIGTLAKAACFSPFHFHRIFASVTGETLYQFILRLRLEKAASLLSRYPEKPVTEIALDLGFSSSATFARAFAARYGMSATDFRKNCKTDRKEGKAESGTHRYLGVTCHPLLRSEPMQSSPSVRPQSLSVDKMPSRTLAYIRHVGPYAGDYSLFEGLWGQIFQWAGPRGLLGKGEAICVYHDNPDITEQEKLRISLGLTVTPDTQIPSPMNTLEIPAGDYVRAKFEIDTRDYPNAWGYIMGEWLPQSGYQCSDSPAYECYLNNPKEHPEGKHIVEIRVGVRPL